MTTTFKLSLCGRYVIEDDGSPHPTIWTIADARARLLRLQDHAAAYEREADLADRDGRTFTSGVSRAMASVDLTLATDLLLVLQGADQREAA